jgi:hypothetical protein
MDERSTKVGELLHEAAETHHQVFRITDGADEDWASWYAQWLVTLSELPEALGGKVVRSELTYLLVRLDKEYTERRVDERWEDYYARELVRTSAQADTGAPAVIDEPATPLHQYSTRPAHQRSSAGSWGRSDTVQGMASRRIVDRGLCGNLARRGRLRSSDCLWPR